MNSNTLTFFKILANYCVHNDYICSSSGPLFQFLMFVIHSFKQIETQTNEIGKISHGMITLQHNYIK